jgi:hypothetical protein
LTTRLHYRGVDALREFALFGRVVARFVAENFSRRKRHCTRGIGIAAPFEYIDTDDTREQSANREHNQSAAEIGGTKIAKLGMQYSGHNTYSVPPNPFGIISGLCARANYIVLRLTNVFVIAMAAVGHPGTHRISDASFSIASDAAVSGHDLRFRSVSRGWAVYFGVSSVIGFCARFPRLRRSYEDHFGVAPPRSSWGE